MWFVVIDCLSVFVLIVHQVLFRLNFLVMVLCVVMDRPYQFYYFVPLVTFWFVLIYGTLAMWPQILQKKANSRFLYSSNSFHLYPLGGGASGVLNAQFVLHIKFLTVVLCTGSSMWHLGVLLKLLGLLLSICFFAFSQVGSTHFKSNHCQLCSLTIC